MGFYASAIFSGCIVQMVTCLTEKSEVTGLISSPTHPFVEIDHEIFPTAIIPFPLIQKGQLSGHLVQVNLSCPGIVWSG